jgi:hypothetical protein
MMTSWSIELKSCENAVSDSVNGNIEQETSNTMNNSYFKIIVIEVPDLYNKTSMYSSFLAIKWMVF